MTSEYPNRIEAGMSRMLMILLHLGNPEHAALHTVYCPMVCASEKRVNAAIDQSMSIVFGSINIAVLGLTVLG